MHQLCIFHLHPVQQNTWISHHSWKPKSNFFEMPCSIELRDQFRAVTHTRTHTHTRARAHTRTRALRICGETWRVRLTVVGAMTLTNVLVPLSCVGWPVFCRAGTAAKGPCVSCRAWKSACASATLRRLSESYSLSAG